MSSYLSNLLNNDVTDVIYTKLHNSHMKDIIPQIHQAINTFEFCIVNNKNPIIELVKNHNITLQMEDDIYGEIYVIMIDHNQFISYHKSDDEEFNDLIIHGFIENNLIKIERVVHKHKLKIYHSMKDIISTNYHSILYVEELFDYEPGQLQIDFNYESVKKWQNHKKIYEWFHECFHNELEWLRILDI